MVALVQERVRGRASRLAEGVWQVRWTKRVLTICIAGFVHPAINGGEPHAKDIVYLGFDSLEAAEAFRKWLLEGGHCTPYNHKMDAGVNKPRPAKRLDCGWELKIHRPPHWLVRDCVKKSK